MGSGFTRARRRRIECYGSVDALSPCRPRGAPRPRLVIRATSLLRIAAAIGAMAALVGAAAPQGLTRADIPSPPGENHGAAIAQLKSGALLACWYSGAHEEDHSVRILCSRGDAPGASWSAPWTAVAPGDQAVGAAAPNKSLGNVTLTVARGGTV